MLHIHKIHIHVQGKQLGTVLRGNYGLFIKRRTTSCKTCSNTPDKCYAFLLQRSSRIENCINCLKNGSLQVKVPPNTGPYSRLHTPLGVFERSSSKMSVVVVVLS